MCDTELLLAYLYDELPASDRQAFDRHLATCAHCREEVAGLRGTRTHLTSWAPPEPDLGFQVVRSATQVASPSRWWRASPAWGLAAAALLVVAASAAIANVQVRFGGDGVVVSTGWNRGAMSGAVPVLSSWRVGHRPAARRGPPRRARGSRGDAAGRDADASGRQPDVRCRDRSPRAPGGQRQRAAPTGRPRASDPAGESRHRDGPRRPTSIDC